MPIRLFIFGGKGTALEIAEVARRLPRPELSGAVHVVPPEEAADGVSRVLVGELASFLESCSDEPAYIVSMWKQDIRRECLQLAEQHGMFPYSVIDPRAHISQSAKIGRGVYVAANSAISTNASIADHVVLNYNVTVGHDSAIGTHSFLNPGARISGNVSIGERVLVGSNAFVFQGKSVGSDSLIDALTYVDRDIAPRMICSGRQSRVLKRVL